MEEKSYEALCEEQLKTISAMAEEAGAGIAYGM